MSQMILHALGALHTQGLSWVSSTRSHRLKIPAQNIKKALNYEKRKLQVFDTYTKQSFQENLHKQRVWGAFLFIKICLERKLKMDAPNQGERNRAHKLRLCQSRILPKLSIDYTEIRQFFAGAI